MVLKKPYAFLIRHFKLLHLIFTGLFVYLIVRMASIIDFISGYLDSDLTMLTNEQFDSIFSWLDFVMPIIVLAFSSLLLFIMTLKKKPNKLYLFAVITSAFTIFTTLYGYFTLQILTKDWIEVSRLNIVSDFYLFGMVANIFLCGMSLSRALGFNFGRFDFNSDLSKFELTEEDDAEFEVSFDFDINDVKRNAKKSFRYAGYFYKENKKLILWTIACVVLVSGLYFGYSLLKYRKDVTKGNILEYNGFTLKVNDAYIVNTDAKGNAIKDGTSLLVVATELTNIGYKVPKAFASGAISVSIGTDIYYPTNKYNDNVTDLGEVYNSEKINANSTVRNLFVFKVPKNHLHSKILLGYRDIDGKQNHYLRLSPTDYTAADNKIVESFLTEELPLENAAIKDAKIVINDFKIDSSYTINYQFCARENRCINSVEYIRPQYTSSSYDKAIIKLTGEFDLSKVDNYNDFFRLFNSFGYIEYTLDGKIKRQSSAFSQLKPTRLVQKDTYYIEVFDEIKNATNICLGLKIRNVDYRYYLTTGRS